MPMRFLPVNLLHYGADLYILVADWFPVSVLQRNDKTHTNDWFVWVFAILHIRLVKKDEYQGRCKFVCIPG